MSKITMPKPVVLCTVMPNDYRYGHIYGYTGKQMEAYAAAKVRESQEWQPIETAPKDGSMILLGRAETEACGAVSVPGYWQEGFDDGVDYMGVRDGFVDVNHQQFSGGRDWGPEKYRYAPNQPTHWRPLPPPPSE